MVREVEKWSGIHIQDRITTKSWLVFPTGAPNDNTTFQCNRLIIFPVILLTDTTKNRTNKQVADNPTWLHNLHLLGANDTTSISVYLCLWTDKPLQQLSLTCTCPWGPTSQPSSERASRLYVRSGACGDLCHDTPCWPWFVHWLSARWTTATRFSLVSPTSCKTGCSPSWMLPPIWFSQRGGQNA